MELASGTGNGRNTTEFTMAKSAVLAAIQTAKVSSTVAANPFERHKDRPAYFRSRKNAFIIHPPLSAEHPDLPQPRRTATCHSVRIDSRKVPLLKARQTRANAATTRVKLLAY